MPLRITLLADASITDDESASVRSRSPRLLELAAYLVVHAGVPQQRQRLAGLFWPDSTDAQALTNLRRELHGMLRALDGHACVEVNPHSLGWRDAPGVHVDVRSFTLHHAAARAAADAGDTAAVLLHGDAALAAYGGEFMPGLYDDWVLDTRVDLQRECVQLCTLLGETRRAFGDMAGAIALAQRRIRLEPADENGYEVLMDLQAEAGDRAGAVSTYHRCVSALERELDLSPGNAIRATLQRVMRQQLPGPTPEPQASGVGRAVGEAVRGDTTTLVGRTAAMSALGRAWREARSGGLRLVVLRGDAGVGKTRLLSEISEQVRRQGAAVGVSRCFGTSGRLPLAPVADWLRGADLSSGESRLEQVWREEVERLVPGGDHRSGPRTGTRAMVDAWQRHRFFDGLARGLLNVGRPTVLVLDNLQWCDRETLAFLTYFLGPAAGAPVLLAATLRAHDLEEEPEVGQWLARMRATGLLEEIDVEPLDEQGTVELAETISSRPYPASGRNLLHVATGGYPLHVIEAMRTVEGAAGAAPPVADLAAVLRSRLEEAGHNAQEVAGLAAAVGRDFSLDLLTEASDLDADAVVDAVDELWRRRIMREHGDGYDFTHDLLRDAAYARVPPARRWLLHRRLAQGLELLHADDLDPVSALLAEQYSRAAQPARAVAYYRRAAEVALAVFAHAEATRLLDAALAIVRGQQRSVASAATELELLESMAAPLNARQGYASPRLHEVLTRCVELAGELGRTESAVTGLVGLWASLFVQGRIKESHVAGSRALALVRPESELAGAAHFAVAGSLQALGHADLSLRHFEKAAERVHDASLTIGTRPDVHSRAWEAHGRWLLGDDAGALACAQQALDRARAAGHPYSLAVALAYAGITHQLRGDGPTLARTTAELEELCRRYGFSYYREWELVLRGWQAGGGKGLALARRGVANLRAEGSFARMPYWLSLVADVQFRSGRHEEAQATLDAGVITARTRGDVWWLPEVLRQRARYDAGPQSRVQRLREAGRLAGAHGSQTLLARCDADLAALGVAPS